jgi:RNA polymerase sigma-70 factor (ECF subfamily)
MYEMEGYSHREIAEALNISVGTSKSQLSKAKKMLRQKIEVLL